jgi:hypothetical protein
MGFLLGLLKWLSSSAFGKLAGAAADVAKARANRDIENERTQVGGDTAIAIKRLEAAAEADRLKAQQRAMEGKWGLTAVCAIVLFALPTGIHWWAIVLDSIPAFGHPVGSWRVAELPGQNLELKKLIIQSFFYTGGAVAIARMFSRRGSP